MTGKDKTGDESEENGTPKGPLEFAEDQRARFTAALEKIRSRTDAAAKILGAVATAALTTVGLTKAPDLFPLPEADWAEGALAVAIGGFIALVVAAGLIVGQLWKVSHPIFTSSDLATMKDELNAKDEGGSKNGKREFKLLTRVYADTAVLNANGNKDFDLKAYENRAISRLTDAEKPENKENKEQLTQEAAVIRAEVLATQARAGALIVRLRAARIATSWQTILGIALFVAGLIAFAGASDLLSSARPDTLTTAVKSCAETRKSIKDAGLKTIDTLPTFCAGSGADPVAAAVPSAHQQQSKTMVALAIQWNDCLVQTKPELQATVCGPTLVLLQTAASAPPPPR